MSLLHFPAAQLAPAAIQYRTEAPVSMGSYALALLVTLCLLGVLTAALLYVRRRGWTAWRRTTRAVAAPEEGIQLQASRRLSLGTTAHVISYRGQAYLVVESSRGTNATLTPIAPHQAMDERTS